MRFSYWKEPQLNDNRLLLCIYNKASSGKRTLPGQLGRRPFASQRVTLPHSSMLSASPDFVLMLPYWATHSLPLSAPELSLAAWQRSKQRLQFIFPYTHGLSHFTPTEKKDIARLSLTEKYLTLWISLNNHLLRFSFVVADIVQYKLLAKTFCWITPCSSDIYIAPTTPNIQTPREALPLPSSPKKLFWNYETERKVLPELWHIWSYFCHNSS